MIDTRVSRKYNEAAFNGILPGDSTNKLIKLLGEPLDVRRPERGVEIWSYSLDGAALFGDFAWLSRRVIVTNGVVMRTEKRTVRN
jgi:hypothetical protein